MTCLVKYRLNKKCILSSQIDIWKIFLKNCVKIGSNLIFHALRAIKTHRKNILTEVVMVHERVKIWFIFSVLPQTNVDIVQRLRRKKEKTSTIMSKPPLLYIRHFGLHSWGKLHGLCNRNHQRTLLILYALPYITFAYFREYLIIKNKK